MISIKHLWLDTCVFGISDVFEGSYLAGSRKSLDSCTGERGLNWPAISVQSRSRVRTVNSDLLEVLDKFDDALEAVEGRFGVSWG